MLRVIPGEVRHWRQEITACAYKAQIGVAASVPTNPAIGPRRRLSPGLPRQLVASVYCHRHIQAPSAILIA
jgi:hypothetical protein